MDSLSTAAAAFKHDKPLAIITEGLFPYLTRDEREVLAGNIHELLEKYPGLWITSDVHTKQILNVRAQFDENAKKRLTRISSSTETALESNFFEDVNDMKQFFEKAGFKMEEYSYVNIFDDLSSVKILNLAQEEILKIQQGFRILKTLILTPINT
jgi:O-methyltransferase involved in polyketide biosynthesis